jgi:hypothetical protein
LLFGVGELDKLRAVIGFCYRWFTIADYGTAVLASLVGTLVNLLVFPVALGGRDRRVALGVSELNGVQEAHDLLESAAAARCMRNTRQRGRLREPHTRRPAHSLASTPQLIETLDSSNRGHAQSSVDRAIRRCHRFSSDDR